MLDFDSYYQAFINITEQPVVNKPDIHGKDVNKIIIAAPRLFDRYNKHE